MEELEGFRMLIEEYNNAVNSIKVADDNDKKLNKQAKKVAEKKVKEVKKTKNKEKIKEMADKMVQSTLHAASGTGTIQRT